jgi:phosphoserine phosphatase
MTALHVFDMDGTLLRGTTAAIEISRRVGRLQPLAELERRFAGEEISAPDFAVETHRRQARSGRGSVRHRSPRAVGGDGADRTRGRADRVDQ